MTPEQWQQVKAIFNSAIEREPHKRAAFLDEACRGNVALRREVESLIASHEREGSFIDSPAYEVAAGMILEDQIELKAGQKIANYEIVSPLGTGGMGEVYLAEDRRLGRKVALKLLPKSFTKDKDRLRRFEQEARAASALNHPNIITIHEIGADKGSNFITTEYVEGETLRRRMRQAPLILDEALSIAIQAADALTAAHKAGIVHRDIKPENIMLRPDGYVKVLDFGLAKLAEKQAVASDDEAPTRAMVRTAPGLVIGTAAYMSPEQARGLTVDERTDIWSLGVVIYEMITGQAPFEGDTPSDLIASILKTEPLPLASLAPDTPNEIVRIVTKALRKNREERYQVVKDMLLDLKSLKEELEFQARLEYAVAPKRSVEAASVTTAQTFARDETKAPTDEIKEARATHFSGFLTEEIKRHKTGTAIILAAFGVAIIAAAFGLYKFLGRHQSTASSNHNSTAEAPAVASITRITAWSGLDAQPTLSPDGHSVAYSSNHQGSFEVYIKQLTPGGREIQVTSDGQENFQPAWSPDGQRIAYFSKKRGGIWVVPTFGGSPRQLTEFGASPAWSHDGAMIAFQSDATSTIGAGSVGSSTIWVVPSEGGTPKQITKVGNPPGGHLLPSWSPNNQRIAFVDLNYTTQQIWSVSITGDGLKQLSHRPSARAGQSVSWRDPLEGRASYPLYSPDGRSIYFVVGTAVWMLPISPTDDEPTDEPVRVTDSGVSVITGLTLSADGKRIAYSAQTLASNIWSLSVSPNSLAVGTPKQLTNQTGARNSQPAFSADGRKLAFIQFLQGGRVSLWVADADGNNPTPTPSYGNIPSWFPDGDRIAFTSARDNHWSVWVTSLQTGREHILYDAGRDIQYARVSPDGQQIAFNMVDERGVINLWTVPVSGGQPRQLTFDQELAGFPAWSPDGKWLAYQMKRGDDAYLMIMPSDGGESTQLTFEHGRSWPYSFSPDGDRVLFAGERDGVWNVYWVSRTTKQQKQLTNYTKLNEFVRYPDWSPLGNQIAYEYSEATGNIWMLDLR
ncbi:MAG: hypothetical protein AUG51_06800 [Acidobacteria bacterium 13_1_20CM_3_53_8]|nr:MAG: hypothetical protein AUG51_06800 [Acidobacteria bacterium 13_1_20CM_3_53_8]